MCHLREWVSGEVGGGVVDGKAEEDVKGGRAIVVGGRSEVGREELSVAVIGCGREENRQCEATWNVERDHQVEVERAEGAKGAKGAKAARNKNTKTFRQNFQLFIKLAKLFHGACATRRPRCIPRRVPQQKSPTVQSNRTVSSICANHRAILTPLPPKETTSFLLARPSSHINAPIVTQLPPSNP